MVHPVSTESLLSSLVPPCYITASCPILLGTVPLPNHSGQFPCTPDALDAPGLFQCPMYAPLPPLPPIPHFPTLPVYPSTHPCPRVTRPIDHSIPITHPDNSGYHGAHVAQALTPDRSSSFLNREWPSSTGNTSDTSEYTPVT